VNALPRPRQISSVPLIISVAFWVGKRPVSGAYLGLIQLFVKRPFFTESTAIGIDMTRKFNRAMRPANYRNMNSCRVEARLFC
jgi:hypothetical protein